MIQINFQFNDINKLINKSLKVELPIKKIAELVLKQNQDNILHGTSSDGSPHTLKKTNSPFIMTGALRDSLKMKENTPTNYDITFEGSVNQQKAIWLQGGTIVKGKQHIKPQHMFGLNMARLKADIDTILKQNTKIALQ